MAGKRKLVEPWIIYGLIAALAFGSNIIAYKKGFVNGTNPFLASIIFSGGVFLTCALAFILLNRNTTLSTSSAVFMLLAGIIWAIGSIAVAVAISQNYDVSKISVIYSSNVIVTVVLSIFFLNELKSGNELIRTIIGMILVVIGIIVVSLK